MPLSVLKPMEKLDDCKFVAFITLLVHFYCISELYS